VFAQQWRLRERSLGFYVADGNRLTRLQRKTGRRGELGGKPVFTNHAIPPADARNDKKIRCFRAVLKHLRAFDVERVSDPDRRLMHERIKIELRIERVFAEIRQNLLTQPFVVFWRRRNSFHNVETS
jgi:hypothetical protein